MIYLASDHGGWTAKEWLRAVLEKSGYRLTDLTSAKPAPTDDYPMVAAVLGKKVAQSKKHLGIGFCRSGVGMTVAANKIAGIRAAQAFNVRMAKKSRTDDNTNILALDSAYHSLSELQKISQVWLVTPYVPQARFERRLREIKKLERDR